MLNFPFPISNNDWSKHKFVFRGSVEWRGLVRSGCTLAFRFHYFLNYFSSYQTCPTLSWSDHSYFEVFISTIKRWKKLSIENGVDTALTSIQLGLKFWKRNWNWHYLFFACLLDFVLHLSLTRLWEHVHNILHHNHLGQFLLPIIIVFFTTW